MFALDVPPEPPRPTFDQTTLYLGPGWVIAGLAFLAISQLVILALVITLVRRTGRPGSLAGGAPSRGEPR
jgi:hypothetical protein